MSVIKIIVFTVLLVVALVFYTLQRNGANLFDPPGFHQRLTTYLTRNTAETSDDPQFPELRTPVFNVDAKTLYQRVLFVAAESGWNVLNQDSENLSTNFVVRTPVFLFEDDVFVQVQFISMDESSLFIRSSSRVGRVDLAANAGHIQELISKIKG